MVEAGAPLVFCSHASPDKPQVLAFADRLRLDGFEAWVDGMEIGGGDDLVEKINQGLSRAAAGLIFFSHHVPAALWTRPEVNYLTHQAVQGLRVIPVMIDVDAPVPPLLAAYLRRRISEYEAVRDDLLGRVRRTPMGLLPERVQSELLVQLTPAGEQVRTRVWLSGAAIADASAPMQALLSPAYTPARTDTALTEVGRACGQLLFPEECAARVSAVIRELRPGDRLEIIIEAGPGLMGLPFETARLPVPGLPLLVGLDEVTMVRRPLAPPARLTPALSLIHI